MDWYTREEFRGGAEYVDADGELCLQYAGTIPAGAAVHFPGITERLLATTDPTEPVLIFMLERDSGRLTFYSHTRADADVGYSFISLEPPTHHSVDLRVEAS